MTDHDIAGAQPEGPWNPGISSALTRQLLALSTIFRPENALNDLSQALELQAATGLPLEQLAIFRPDRLALHEVLIRATADFETPDPDDAQVSSLGPSLRRIAQVLLQRAVEPNGPELAAIYGRVRDDLKGFIAGEVASSWPSVRPGGSGASAGPARGFWSRFGRRARPQPEAAVPETDWDRTKRVLGRWRAEAGSAENPVHAAAFHALAQVAAALQLRHGRIIGLETFFVPLATDLACNECGGQVIGHYLDPIIRRVAEEEGFRHLPRQHKPIAMITKGASASGKSTMRPYQRKLASRMGQRWSDYALISPDIWRKALLDFQSLGPFYKYAGMLTSQEVMIIDRKLDAYLVSKGRAQGASHLLIDRFRFDSFALDSPENKHLPSSFGSTLCYFFMITPPREIVERGWRRGLEVGRYKAVDDLLAHSVEAYTGMQDILFGRALNAHGSVHYELLNNDVPRGTVPLTVAFGWSGEMNVFDIKCMLDMERYRKVNVDARSPGEIFLDGGALAAENNASFLIECVRRFRRVNFAQPETGRIYAQFEAGKLAWADEDALTKALADAGLGAGFRPLSPASPLTEDRRGPPEPLDHDQYLTIGQWTANRAA